MEPLVSIVIPVYNTEKYISECLDSLINQVYGKFEVICVDDGSTDFSREIIREYEKRDARIQLITQEHSNAGAARNRGLEIAEGDFIAFLDSDDFFEPAMIEKMLEKAILTQADLVICRNIYYDNESGIYNDMGLTRFQNAGIPNWNNFSKEDIPDHIFELTPCAWDKLFKMSFIRGNDLKFQEQPINNDMLFVYKSFILAKRMAICDDVTVIYRTNNKNSTQGRWYPWWKCRFHVFESLKQWLQEKGNYELVERSFVNKAAEGFIGHIEAMNEWESYVEYYEYFKNIAIPEFKLFPRVQSFYYNINIYKRLEYISGHNYWEYVFYHRNKLMELNKEYVSQIKRVNYRIQKINMTCKGLKEINKKVKDTNKCLKKIIQCKHWYFKEDRLPEGSRVAIYGYGDVGSDLVEQLSNSRRICFEAVIDQNYEKFSGEPVVVRSMEGLYKITFDYIIIAIRNKDIVNEIREMLIKEGICPEKIVDFDTE